MKKSVSFFLAVALFVSGSALASKSNIMRGGVGFLYPDHNSFKNPGQTSMGMGTGLEFKYGYQQSTTAANQTGTVSMAWASKKFALALAGSRSGSELLSDTSSDSVEAGLGASLGKRVTVGATYGRSIDAGQSNNGTVRGTVTLNPGKAGRGLTIGAAYSHVLGPATHGLLLGFGFSGNKNGGMFEASFELPDLSATSAFKAGGAVTLAGKSVYFGAGYTFDNSGATSNHDIDGRIGLLLSKSGGADLSAFVTYTTETGVNPTFGGTFRALF